MLRRTKADLTAVSLGLAAFTASIWFGIAIDLPRDEHLSYSFWMAVVVVLILMLPVVRQVRKEAEDARA